MPAHNLAIDAVDTTGVLQSDEGQVRTFTALADDAVLNVADVQAAFQGGFDVVVSTGEGGGSTGNIVWRAGADAYFAGSEEPQYLSLTLQTDPLDSGRNVDIEANLAGSPADNSPFRGLSVYTGGSAGAVTLHQIEVAGGWLTVVAGDAGLFLHGDLSTHGGGLTLTGDVLLENSAVLNTSADDPTSFGSGSVFISGAIDGDGDPKDLSILAGHATIHLERDLGGVQHQLGNLTLSGDLGLAADRAIDVQSRFTLAAGTLDLASHTLTVSTGPFSIGDGATDGYATLTGVGTVHADSPIQVAGDGVVSPGRLRNVGTLEVVGSIQFQAGSKFVVDLDATPDSLHVTGSVQLDAGALLFGGSGVLSGPGPFEVLTADGGRTGLFANTQAPIGLADDVVTVSYTANAVGLEPSTASNGKRSAGVTSDGTLYTVQLTGAGNAQLQVFESFRTGSVVDYRTVAKEVPYTYTVAVPVIFVQRTQAVFYETVPVDTGTSTVYVTNPVLREVEVEVTAYRHEARTAVKTVYEQVPFQRDELVRALDIRVSNSTRANQLVITTAANGGFGSLDVGRIVVSGALGGLVAPTTSLGGLQVDGRLGHLRLGHLRGPLVSGGNSSQRASIDIPWIEGDITTGSAIASLTSNQVGQVTITAPRIGRLVTTANQQNHLAGDFNATLALDAGFRSALALGSADIAGGISGSTWNVRGSVGPVTVQQTVQGWSLGDGSEEAPLGSIQSLHLGDVHESNIRASGRIGELTAASWDGFMIQAESLGSIQVAGGFSAYLSLDAGLSTAKALGSATLGSVTGTWDVRGSLGPVTVTQTVDGWELGAGRLGAIQALHLGEVARLSIHANGHVGTLSGEFTGSADSNATIQARSIGALNVTGDFTGSLVLDAGDETRVALRSAHLERIHDSSWDIRGSLGRVTVDDSASGWTLGATDDFGSQHPDQLANLRELRVGGQLHSSAIHAVGRIGSLRAAQWQVTQVTARSLGALNVTGDFLFSDVTLTGASKRVGLGTVHVAGRVFGSTFNVLAGNVASFTCGRFEHSGLYVGYDTANGQFLHPWTLATFKTTSTPAVAHQSDPRTDAFEDSWIVAARFGRITLTGVTINNGGSAFGLRVSAAANAGQVRINTAPFTPGVNVQPGTTTGDFQFLTS